ncbi:Uncharacterized protein Fot_52349 [Forsythia ovata]|uniref:Uncharacterized protein n=1 Tax=Forsythia ovata TaxID=205694 RepID=A0ABD1PLZ2_9LAMI
MTRFVITARPVRVESQEPYLECAPKFNPSGTARAGHVVTSVSFDVRARFYLPASACMLPTWPFFVLFPSPLSACFLLALRATLSSSPHQPMHFTFHDSDPSYNIKNAKENASISYNSLFNETYNNIRVIKLGFQGV